jgi:hypothetical protein
MTIESALSVLVDSMPAVSTSTSTTAATSMLAAAGGHEPVHSRAAAQGRDEPVRPPAPVRDVKAPSVSVPVAAASPPSPLANGGSRDFSSLAIPSDDIPVELQPACVLLSTRGEGNPGMIEGAAAFSLQGKFYLHGGVASSSGFDILDLPIVDVIGLIDQRVFARVKPSYVSKMRRILVKDLLAHDPSPHAAGMRCSALFLTLFAFEAAITCDHSQNYQECFLKQESKSCFGLVCPLVRVLRLGMYSHAINVL